MQIACSITMRVHVLLTAYLRHGRRKGLCLQLARCFDDRRSQPGGNVPLHMAVDNPDSRVVSDEADHRVASLCKNPAISANRGRWKR